MNQQKLLRARDRVLTPRAAAGDDRYKSRSRYPAQSFGFRRGMWTKRRDMEKEHRPERPASELGPCKPRQLDDDPCFFVLLSGEAKILQILSHNVPTPYQGAVPVPPAGTGGQAAATAIRSVPGQCGYESWDDRGEFRQRLQQAKRTRRIPRSAPPRC